MSFARSFVEGMAMFAFVVVVAAALVGPPLALVYIGTSLFGDSPITLALGIGGLAMGLGLAGALIDTLYRRMTNA